MITLAVISALYASLFGLLTSGKLKTSQYIFLMAGLGIGIRYMVYNTHFQFYTQMILILIVGVTIHTSKAQMVIVYSFVNAMVIIRAYFLYNLITVGVISENMLSQSLQAALGIALFSVIIAYFNKVLNSEIEESKELGQISVSDSLTHLPNRAKFNATIKEYLDEEKPYMLAILDIDYFKRVNDSLGHNVGDQVLIHMANLMRDYFKDECDIFRWGGGEEFAVVSNKLTGIQAFEKK